MITISLPDSPLIDVVLQPENRVEKGLTAAPHSPLENQVSLGTPIVIALTPERVGEDRDLAEFVKAEAATFRYYLVHMACTFNPSDDAPFVKAWYQVNLSRQDGATDALPIAWSMEPDRQQEKVDISSNAELGFDLKLLSGKIKDPATVVKETSLQALYELQPTPTWEFTQTSLDPIKGNYRLRMVVRAPKDVASTGTIGLTATVQKKHLGIFPYHAEFPPVLPQTFTLV
jgi:hypothetical protein